MLKNNAIIIHWSGPYTFQEAIEQKKMGLYLVYGRNKKGPSPIKEKLLYCGVSANRRGVGQRISNHKNKSYNYEKNNWWIGRQVYPNRKNRKFLEWAEWIIIYFNAPEHCDRKSASPPKEEIYLINEWFSKDGRRRLNQIGVMQSIEDVQCWSPVSKLHRKGNLRIYDHNN